MTSPTPRARRATGRGRGPGAPPPPPPNIYPTYKDWFTDVLSVVYARHEQGNASGAYRWCPEWSIHAEAAERIAVMHGTWEEANRSTTPPRPVAMASWWINVCDPMMRELLSQQGTFAGCSTLNGHDPNFTPLPD